jgi:hypothetical protein
MPTEFALPAAVANQWKLKIRDKERLEPPHVSVLNGSRCWRYGLREHAWLDKEPPPKQVPPEVVGTIHERFGDICSAWDRMYPHNPVSSKD